MFDGPRLKVERANKHIAELATVIDGYVNSKFCEFAFEFDADTKEHVFAFRAIEPPPWDIPLVIGDAVHNLRSALDILVYGLVAATGRPAKHAKFPFYETQKQLIAAVDGGHIRAVGAEIIRVIIDEVRPYRDGGNNAICGLHDLDISDKHLVVLPTFNATQVFVERLVMPGFSMTNSVIRIEAGNKLNIMGGAAVEPVKFEGNIQPSFGVFFAKDQPFAGQPILPTLHQLSQFVSGVIDAIERAYLARRS